MAKVKSKTKAAKNNISEIGALQKELETIKLLLALQLRQSGVPGVSIAKAMGITKGRVSQLLADKKKKKTSEK